MFTQKFIRPFDINGVSYSIIVNSVALLCLSGFITPVNVTFGVKFEAITAFVDVIRGNPIGVDSMVKEARAEAGKGGIDKVSFTLTNRGAKEVRVIGSKAPCTCVTTTEIPFSIKPGASRTLTLGFPYDLNTDLSSTKKIYEIIVFTNIKSQHFIKLSVIFSPSKQ